MFEQAYTFSGISVDDLEAARSFYGDTLGLGIRAEMGGLRVFLPGGAELWIYPKRDHQPATFTVLNFSVPDIDAAVDALNAAGVTTKIYDDPRLGTDTKGVQRGRTGGWGPDIAWFRDPAGNVLAVLDRGR
jgi:catechol 2,3-dioxygenase-like lactoylglutathione lyase family enzyme